ncbi:hypothetical protein EMIHUDRAFT_248363, partial [Emiliania huxleyi CCMP1516]|uniref:DNA (cytosine-5-)-methyltransferase n=2 Tax=Emiliania huxleyi TaxID=2903 RepID=A0A0D3IGK8_EMIH1
MPADPLLRAEVCQVYTSGEQYGRVTELEDGQYKVEDMVEVAKQAKARAKSPPVAADTKGKARSTPFESRRGGAAGAAASGRKGGAADAPKKKKGPPKKKPAAKPAAKPKPAAAKPPAAKKAPAPGPHDAGTCPRHAKKLPATEGGDDDDEEEEDSDAVFEAKPRLKPKKRAALGSGYKPLAKKRWSAEEIEAQPPAFDHPALATMCSGTESPLLALDMICGALKAQSGQSIAVEHVFSCEIEPFKQAYIERNFAPPLLFRDIRELGDEEATTAYGATRPVPGEVDVLIAGTSCVDYSTMNNKQKKIDEKGESGQTFWGMLAWVKRTRPSIVVQENVCSAPWEEMVGYYAKEGYAATFLRAAISELSCPASSSLEAFLLPTDDPRVHTAREDLSHIDPTKQRGVVDWGRCETRHQRARTDEELGAKRPLTQWVSQGHCAGPDFAWHDWFKSQVERVVDLCDINYLRLAREGQDANYKTLVWNLSQNVDRSTASSRPGVCPCLTPNMVPYVTNRGGPIVGPEVLALQG